MLASGQVNTNNKASRETLSVFLFLISYTLLGTALHMEKCPYCAFLATAKLITIIT